MSDHKRHLEDLKEIRSIMERSSRFISLSGLSGIFAGIYALAGAVVAWMIIQQYGGLRYSKIAGFFRESSWIGYDFNGSKYDFILYLIVVGATVLLLAVTTGIYLTTRQARKKGQSIWDKSSQRMLINLAIPLITGGVFCIILLLKGWIGIIAPAMLIFYGLALINGSKYTLTDIRYLGFCEIILGLISMFYIGYGLLFWAMGFGVLHIVYGSVMYFKYER